MRPNCPFNMNFTFPSAEFAAILLSFSSSGLRESSLLWRSPCWSERLSALRVLEPLAALRACQVSIRLIGHLRPGNRTRTHLTEVSRWQRMSIVMRWLACDANGWPGARCFIKCFLSRSRLGIRSWAAYSHFFFYNMC